MGRMIPERVVQNRVVQGLMMRGKFYDSRIVQGRVVQSRTGRWVGMSSCSAAIVQNDLSRPCCPGPTC